MATAPDQRYPVIGLQPVAMVGPEGFPAYCASMVVLQKQSALVGENGTNRALQERSGSYRRTGADPNLTPDEKLGAPQGSSRLAGRFTNP